MIVGASVISFDGEDRVVGSEIFNVVMLDLLCWSVIGNILASISFVSVEV